VDGLGSHYFELDNTMNNVFLILSEILWYCSTENSDSHRAAAPPAASALRHTDLPLCNPAFLLGVSLLQVSQLSLLQEKHPVKKTSIQVL